ncbi:MAG: helix-turn-helix domain-containing protein [Saccharofermentanales bacterium]
MKNSLSDVGIQIKNLRERSGFTQKNIADFLKVDQSLISKFESGERPISSDMLDKLATLFGCSLEAFTEATDDVRSFSFALRSSELCDEDLNTVSAINRIALNSAFMASLLESDVH